MNEPKLRFKDDDGSQFPDWEEKKLGDDVQFLNGRAYKQDELLKSGKYLVLRVGNLFTNDSYYYSDLELDDDKYIENGNLIYAWSATFGPRIYHGKKCIYHYHIWKLKFDENAISKMFLNYCLLHDVENVKSQRTGGTMEHITKNAMENRKLYFPCFAEQKKIAEFLSTIDTAIAKQKETVSAWEERKKGVMQKLFSQEVRFKADDGSDFPEWEEKKLGDDVQFLNGRAYKQDELLKSGKYLVLRVGNLFTNDSYYYSDLELDDDKYIENGNLIYAWSATFGPRIYHGEKCIYHYHIWKLKFDENAFSKMFLNYCLLHDVENIKSQRTGGTMVHITKNAMENRKLYFPCLAEQQKIADCLSSLDEVIEKQKATLAAWEELKKGLLQQMFV